MKNIREAFLKMVERLCTDYYEQEGHSKLRRQLESVAIKIENPLETREIEGIEARGIPSICSVEYAEEYFEGLMETEHHPYYQYTYGNRIGDQIVEIVDLLKNGYTNNAQLVIASPQDHELSDRPCLQLVDFKALPGRKLDMHVYFRSWDIFALPYNLIGLSYLFELIAEETYHDVNHMYAYSSGLNCRDEMVKLLEKVNKYMQLW